MAERSKGCIVSKGCTVSSSRTATGMDENWCRKTSGGEEAGLLEQWFSEWWSPLEQEQTGGKENSTVQKYVYLILVPETSEVQWVFPTCWLAFLYELQECLQEASIIDQEVQPS